MLHGRSTVCPFVGGLGVSTILQRVLAGGAAIDSELVLAVLTLLIALYGAVLATVLGVRQMTSDRLIVFVTHGWGIDIQSGKDQTLILSAVNNGRRDVIVSTLALEIPGFGSITPGFLDQVGSNVASDDQAQGRLLRPSERVNVTFDRGALQTLLGAIDVSMPVRARGVLKDTLENHYFSSRFELEEA